MAEPNVAPVPRLVTEDELAGLLARVRSTQQVTDPWKGDESRGFGPDALKPLLEHWANRYDWRAHEQRIGAFPWEIVGSDDRALRVVHQRAADADAPAVVLLHGWPDSVLRFERLLPLLTDLNVVLPALPGYPFALGRQGVNSVDDIAELVVEALESLGYERYVISGGDVGGDVAEVIAGLHPDRVAAMHLTNVSPRHAQMVDPDQLDGDAREYLSTAGAWFRSDGGYIVEQATKPRTLIAGLGDSPAALAAWILEKVTAWSDDSTASFSVDDLLTWVCAYWFTGSIGTSFSTYVEPAHIPERTEVPTVVSAFAADIKPAPQAYAKAFVDLREFVARKAGGHFAAWEQPQAYAEDLRAALALV